MLSLCNGVMDLRERHLGPCAVRDVDTGVVTVAADVLQQNPVLFETCIVQSHELLELPRIIELFGYWGLMALLKSGVLQFQLDRIFALNVDPIRED